MALAIPTRFFIPPEISEVAILLALIRLTFDKHRFTRSILSSLLMLLNINNGNSTFCSTDKESNKAVPWNSMPISLLRAC